MHINNDLIVSSNRTEEVDEQEPPLLCPVCNRPAETGTIECSKCNTWIHYECENMEHRIDDISLNAEFMCSPCVLDEHQHQQNSALQILRQEQEQQSQQTTEKRAVQLNQDASKPTKKTQNKKLKNRQGQQHNGKENESNSNRSDNVLIQLCPVCDHPSGNEAIECKRCNKWLHHECENIEESRRNDFPEAEYTCSFCFLDEQHQQSNVLSSAVEQEYQTENRHQTTGNSADTNKLRKTKLNTKSKARQGQLHNCTEAESKIAMMQAEIARLEDIVKEQRDTIRIYKIRAAAYDTTQNQQDKKEQNGHNTDHGVLESYNKRITALEIETLKSRMNAIEELLYHTRLTSNHVTHTLTTDVPSRSDVGMGFQATSQTTTNGDNTRQRGNNYSEDEEDTRLVHDTQGSKQQQQHRPEGGKEQTGRSNYKVEKPRNMTALIQNQERQRCHPNTDCQYFLGYGRANSKTPIEEPLYSTVEHRQGPPYHQLNHTRPQTARGVTSHHQQNHMQQQTAAGVTPNHQQIHLQSLTAAGVTSHYLQPQTTAGVTPNHQKIHLQPLTVAGVTPNHKQNSPAASDNSGSDITSPAASYNSGSDITSPAATDKSGSDFTQPTNSPAATDSSGSDITSPAATDNSGSGTKSPANSSTATGSSGSDITLPANSPAATDNNGSDITPTAKSSAATDNSGSDITQPAKSSAASDKSGNDISPAYASSSERDAKRPTNPSSVTDPRDMYNISPTYELSSIENKGSDIKTPANASPHTESSEADISPTKSHGVHPICSTMDDESNTMENTKQPAPNNTDHKRTTEIEQHRNLDQSGRDFLAKTNIGKCQSKLKNKERGKPAATDICESDNTPPAKPPAATDICESDITPPVKSSAITNNSERDIIPTKSDADTDISGSDITSPAKLSAATDNSGSDITSPAKLSAATDNSGSDITSQTKLSAATDNSGSDITSQTKLSAATDNSGSDITLTAKPSAAIENSGKDNTPPTKLTAATDSNGSEISPKKSTADTYKSGSDTTPTNMDRSGRDFLAKTGSDITPPVKSSAATNNSERDIIPGKSNAATYSSMSDTTPTKSNADTDSSGSDITSHVELSAATDNSGSDITSPAKSTAAADNSGSDITSPAKSTAAADNSGSDITSPVKSTAAADNSGSDITPTAKSTTAADNSGNEITPTAKSSAATDNSGSDITSPAKSTAAADNSGSDHTNSKIICSRRQQRE